MNCVIEVVVYETREDYGSCHAKMCLQASADSEGPNQPAHPSRLIRALAVCKQNHSILQNVSMES